MLWRHSDAGTESVTVNTSETHRFKPIERIPNAATLQAIADTEAGNTTTYGSVDELFRDLESED